jgi:hypothetical protein
VVALLVLCLYLFRAPILRSAAWPLITEEPPEGVEWVLILSGDQSSERAAQLFRESGAQVLLVQGQPGRLERLGILPPRETRARIQLARQGVPEGAVVSVPSEGGTDWDAARALRGWLERRPEARVAALCDRFDSRRQRLVLDRILGPESGRVRLLALPNRSHDETCWWTQKGGTLDLCNSYLRLGHAWWCGESDEPWQEWDPDSYEKGLK